MSESESVEHHVPTPGVPLTDADQLVQRLDPRAVPEREGLPRSYRMRADSHYVEQLSSPAQPVIRMLATAHIECRDLPAPERIEALTKSIASHGVLQPLLVRRHGARYSLIAGRKRLAAAIAANLGAVPCLLHEAEGAAAAAIADADNLRVDNPPMSGWLEQDALHSHLQLLATDLSTIQTSLSLLSASGPAGLSHKVGADLIGSQTLRAAWLVNCLTGTFEDSRRIPLGATIQRVADSFEPHTALTGLQLECSVTAAASVWQLPEESTTAIIKGAVFATLSSLDDVTKPCIELRADTPQPRTLNIEVIQRAVRISHRLGHVGQQESGKRPGELISTLALRLARGVTGVHGGTADLTPLPGVGSMLRMTFLNANGS